MLQPIGGTLPACMQVGSAKGNEQSLVVLLIGLQSTLRFTNFPSIVMTLSTRILRSNFQFGYQEHDHPCNLLFQIRSLPL